jgi:hypothetical protein
VRLEELVNKMKASAAAQHRSKELETTDKTEDKKEDQ